MEEINPNQVNNLIDNNINRNNIEQALDINKLNPSLLKVDSGTQLVKRKVVGGVLTGTGITGLVGAGIAGTLVAVKVGGTGVVTALAGLVGAAAAPWVAIAIAGIAVAALIALTVTGIYLLATKPEDKDLKKIYNNLLQAAKDKTTKEKEFEQIKSEIENLGKNFTKIEENKAKAVFDPKLTGDAPTDQQINSQKDIIQKMLENDKIKGEISNLEKKASTLKNEINNLNLRIQFYNIELVQAVRGKVNKSEDKNKKISSLINGVFKQSPQIIGNFFSKEKEIDNENEKEIDDENEKEIDDEDKKEIDNKDKKEINNNNNINNNLNQNDNNNNFDKKDEDNNMNNNDIKNNDIKNNESDD